MAKAPKKKPAVGGLAGKAVAFVGKFGYRDGLLDALRPWAVKAGAREVEPTERPDVLVVGEGRGGKPPGEAARVQKQNPAVTLLDPPALACLVLPTPDELLGEIARGRRGDRDRFWADLAHVHLVAGRPVDLTGADLRKADLYGAKLDVATLDRADLRAATTEYTHFGDLRGANLDGAKAKNVYLRNLADCTFRKADLDTAWLFWADADRAEGCDFTGANMHAARAERATFTACTFTGTDLSDAELEESTFDRCDFRGADLSRVHAHKAKLAGANLARAKLHRADLRDASLANADLTGADLKDAVLTGADLTGATVDGADFAGAVLTGASLGATDVSRAKNLKPPVARTPGPKVREMAAAAAGAKRFQTAAEVDLGKGEFARLRLSAEIHGNRTYVSARSEYSRDGNEAIDRLPARTVDDGLLNLADRWPNSTLRLDTVTANGSRTVRGRKLQDLARAAWAEAFGVGLATPEELQRRKDAQQVEASARRDGLMRAIRRKGAKVWNDLGYQERDRYDLCGIDLSGGRLSKIRLWGRKDLLDANFSGAALEGAELWNSALDRANFQNAKLGAADLQNSKCERASFAGADLTNANLGNTRLRGADLTGATLKGTRLTRAQFDEKTKFPAGFKPPKDMVWKGKGPRPGLRPARRAKVGSLDFDGFVKKLGATVEPGGRLASAKKMLKADRFQLFADVTEDAVSGVVKSQTSKDLVYACRLGADGRYSCGTQNLRPCGGLGGAPCKHLLVLILGLAKVRRLDPATADAWLDASRGHHPDFDKDAISETFIRYKGAEAGEVDWRPTETLPEDFYAM